MKQLYKNQRREIACLSHSRRKLKSPDKRTRGMLQLEQLDQLVREDRMHTVIVAFTDHYGRLMGKRYDAELFV
jgi:hypothetical protein